MKRTSLVAWALFAGLALSAQTSVSTNSRLRDMAGKQIISSAFDNQGKPYIVCFWSFRNNDSQEFLHTAAANYKQWQAKTGVKIITVAVDEEQHQGKVFPYIQARGWTYENYVDENQEYKKLMNVQDIPHIFVFNSRKEIILELHSYQAGDELAILQALAEAE